MNAPRDPDRLIRTFLMEGEEQLQDPIYDEVRVAIERKRQRAFIGPWRAPAMNKITFGLGAAAVLVIGLILGAQLLGSPNSNVGGPRSTPTVEPTPTPTPEPSPTPTAEGGLPQGPHALTDAESMDGMPPLPMMVTIPAPGWVGDSGGGILEKGVNGADPPDGAGLIVFTGDLYVYGDPCQWSTSRPETPATTIDELVAALGAQATRNASEPVDITLDGYAGQAITLHVPDDADFGDCDSGVFGSWGIPGSDVTPFRYHQGPGQIDEIWVVDVDGTLAIVDRAYYEETPQAVVDELRSMVESITFEQP